jgi:hypothetical protein
VRDQLLHEVDELVSRMIEGLLTDEERQRLNRLLSDFPDAVKCYQELLDNHEALCAIYPGDLYESLNSVEATLTPVTQSNSHVNVESHQGRLRGIAIVASLASVVALLLLSIIPTLLSSDDKMIATVTDLSGSHAWTGDRGEIVRDISVGTQLAGGTIEGMAPDSWFELQFNDGSKITIAGISVLTFSDDGQKILRLREGQLTADVNPQPKDRPMLVHTRTALMEVVGTRFDVQSALASTTLNVSEGRVRIRRLSDGSEVDVPENHLVVADGENRLVPAPVPHSVYKWVSDFESKPDNYGKWKPASPNRPASVKAISLIPEDAPHVTLHLAGLSVSRSDGATVVVKPGARFVVRGRIETETPVYFGIRVNDPDGEFAGMFRGDLQEDQPPVRRSEAGEFTETYEVAAFSVDPAVWDKRHKLASRPDHMVLDGVWAFTHSGSPSGLEIIEVQLLPPEVE